MRHRVRRPPGGYFRKIDRFSGALAARRRHGRQCGGRIFRDGQDSVFANAVVDGGFAMGANLPLFAYGETDGSEGGVYVTTSTGETRVIPKKADFGTVCSGGLY